MSENEVILEVLADKAIKVELIPHVDDAFTASLEPLYLSVDELAGLLEYSTSIPTGTTLGKRWKRNIAMRGCSPRWTVGEYVPDRDPKIVGIKWYRVEDPSSKPQISFVGQLRTLVLEHGNRNDTQRDKALEDELSRIEQSCMKAAKLGWTSMDFSYWHLETPLEILADNLGARHPELRIRYFENWTPDIQGGCCQDSGARVLKVIWGDSNA